jgi:dCMP deaminase
MSRPDKDTYFLQMAKLVATRSTCLRRQVGAVAVNSLGHVLATGYNGVPAGEPHCNHYDEFDVTGYPHACEGACSKSGTNLDGCGALHAEWNMLIQVKDAQSIDTVYCTTAPCVTCTKMLMNTSAKRIIFCDDYPGSDQNMVRWERSRGPSSWLQKSVYK